VEKRQMEAGYEEVRDKHWCSESDSQLMINLPSSSIEKLRASFSNIEERVNQ